MNEIVVQVGGRATWRFTPYGPLGADEIVTPRLTHYPPTPQGATLLRDGQPLGTVRCVRRQAFSRYVIVFDPLAPPKSTPTPTVSESVGAPVFEEGGGSDLAVLGLPDWVVAALVEGGMTTLDALDALDADGLMAIPHIGVRSAITIRAALNQVLRGEEDA